MKRLVLSEGRRDIRLVGLFYEEISPDTCIDTFYGEDVSYDRLKSHESKAIRNFLERRNPYHVLVKSENGKPNLKRVFIKLIRFLVTSDVRVVLLIDLDGDEFDALIDDLDTRVEDTYQGSQLGVKEVEKIDHSHEMLASRLELYSKSNGDRHGCFKLLAFYNDLETASGIDESNGGSSEEQKLRHLVTDKQVCGPMRSVLL